MHREDIVLLSELKRLSVMSAFLVESCLKVEPPALLFFCTSPALKGKPWISLIRSKLQKIGREDEGGVRASQRLQREEDGVLERRGEFLISSLTCSLVRFLPSQDLSPLLVQKKGGENWEKDEK